MFRSRGDRVSSSGNLSNSMRDNYGEHGVDEYYRRVGATYRNPHFPGVKACIFHWLNEWYHHEFQNNEGVNSGPLIFDMACGSGEVTVSILEWWEIGKRRGASGAAPGAAPNNAQFRQKGVVPPSLPTDTLSPRILAADPYTSEAYRQRTSMLCSSLSFRDIAEGALPPILCPEGKEHLLILRVDSPPDGASLPSSADGLSEGAKSVPSPGNNGCSSENISLAVEDITPPIGAPTPTLEMVVCSFALHLIDNASELFALLWELSMKTKWLIVIAPHKKPEIKEGWGWRKWNPMRWEPCQMLEQQNDILHDRVHCRVFRSYNV